MSESSRHAWRDQHASLQEQLKGFLQNPGSEQLDAVIVALRSYAEAASSGQLDIPQRWTIYS